MNIGKRAHETLKRLKKIIILIKYYMPKECLHPITNDRRRESNN